MKQVFNSAGTIVVKEVPAPACGDNEVLVQNAFSLISSGTESASLEQGGKGIMGRLAQVKDNPEMVPKALDMMRKEGVGKTWRAVRGKPEESLIPLGYSSSGVVLEVGKDIADISPGDKVACAGAGYAWHAEVIAVPRNLVSKIPAGVEFDEAAFTTLGAISLQGIRRAQVQLGDRVVVMGLGLLGQLTCQILKASGAQVIGLDPLERRVKLAIELIADLALVSGENIVSEVLRHTDGLGADAVIICAATPSSEPVRQAMQMARKKGRVVVVGAVGMELQRSPFYEKELDFLISCAYGPGRYDTQYEEKGMDYPLEYVRWTENRNMQAFLGLLAQKKVNVRRLVDLTFPIEQAREAYEALGGDPERRPLAVLFQYPSEPQAELRRVVEIAPSAKVAGKISVAVIGAGSYAKAQLLPELKRIPGYNIRAIVTRTGRSARALADKYGVQYCSTDYRQALDDKDVDMVVIATRHNLHAPLIVEAAGVGKQIFVEKPVALSYAECREVYEAIDASRVSLVVGFNRRFSPLAQKAREILAGRKGPLMVSYRVNSAGMARGHWINDPLEGGGAIVGEGCHFFDFLSWLIGAEPKRIYAEKISSGDSSLVDDNNIVCTLSYKDGSVASLVYTTVGHQSFPKERVEIFGDGQAMAITDFKELLVFGGEGKGEKLSLVDKGQHGLLLEYGRLLTGKGKSGDLPDVMDGIRATVCSLKALEALKTGTVQEFAYPW